MASSTLTLIPSPLHAGALYTINSGVADAIVHCEVIYAEQLRTARRFFKALLPAIVIDEKEWVEIGKTEEDLKAGFLQHLKRGKQVGVVSEAGCPGIADPGQLLAGWAHQAGVQVKPLVGPNSMLLALMASGLNGQQYCFNGYLAIEQAARREQIKHLQQQALEKGITQLFMETPYRNEQLMKELLHMLSNDTMLCIAANLTGPAEFIATKPVGQWKAGKWPTLHKQPCVFLIGRKLAV